MIDRLETGMSLLGSTTSRAVFLQPGAPATTLAHGASHRGDISKTGMGTVPTEIVGAPRVRSVLFAAPGASACSSAATTGRPAPLHIRCGITVTMATGTDMPQRRRSASIRPSRQTAPTASVTTSIASGRGVPINVALFPPRPTGAPVSTPLRKVTGSAESLDPSNATTRTARNAPSRSIIIRSSTTVCRQRTIENDISMTRSKSSQRAGAGRRTGIQRPSSAAWAAVAASSRNEAFCEGTRRLRGRRERDSSSCLRNAGIAGPRTGIARMLL